MNKLKEICFEKYGYKHEYQIMNCHKESIRKKYHELIDKYYSERNSLYVGNRDYWSGTNIPILSGDFVRDCYADYTFGNDTDLMLVVGDDPIPVDVDELNQYNEHYSLLKEQEQNRSFDVIDETVSSITNSNEVISNVFENTEIVSKQNNSLKGGYPFPRFNNHQELCGIPFTYTSIDDVFEMKELRRADLFIDKQYRNVINEYNKSPSRSYTFMYNVYHRLLYHSLKAKKKINNLEWLPKLDYSCLNEKHLDDIDKFWQNKRYEVDTLHLFQSNYG